MPKALGAGVQPCRTGQIPSAPCCPRNPTPHPQTHLKVGTSSPLDMRAQAERAVAVPRWLPAQPWGDAQARVMAAHSGLGVLPFGNLWGSQRAGKHKAGKRATWIGDDTRGQSSGGQGLSCTGLPAGRGEQG